MSYLPDSRVTWIVIHYSATAIERDFTAADIDQMHRDRGFKEIGYHFFIRKDGTVETGRDLSEPGRFEIGAHSKGENDDSIGICYEGGVRAAAPNVGFDSRTSEQTASMVKLIYDLLDRFPGAIVEGHRDMPGAKTQCPGFNARGWWDSVVASGGLVVDPAVTAEMPMSAEKVDEIVLQHGLKDDDKTVAWQWGLNVMMFDAGEADGWFGDKTERATKAFQRSSGLPETGIVTQQVWDRAISEIAKMTTEIKAGRPPRTLKLVQTDDGWDVVRADQVATGDEIVFADGSRLAADGSLTMSELRGTEELANITHPHTELLLSLGRQINEALKGDE